jgi:hypothetical protein
MKNLHLLPTDKTSRLYKHNELGFKLLAPVQHEMGAYNGSNQHIYITSDEEIKEDEYYLSWQDYYNPPRYVVYVKSSGINGNGKKIILTTDQDLIKDGVRAIDDEFLEWFVNNPSCEYVEIKTTRERNGYHSKHKKWHKIIIPKEQPKQETTLEEAAEKYHNKISKKRNTQLGVPYQDFEAGAKWQAEQFKYYLQKLNELCGNK